MSMEPPTELNDLMERIRAAVKAAQHTALPADDSARAAVSNTVAGNAARAAEIQRGSSRCADAGIAHRGAGGGCFHAAPAREKKTEISAGVPKILRPVYRNQGGFNGIALAAMERLVEASRHLQSQNAHLQEQVDHLEIALTATFTQQHEWMTAVTATHERQREWMAAVESSLMELGGSQSSWERRLKSFKEKAPSQEVLPVNGQPMGEGDPAALQEISSQLTSVDDHVNRLGDHLKNLQAQVDDHSERYANWHSHYRQTTAHHDLLDQMTRRLEERQHNDASYMKNQLWFLQRLVQPLLAKEPPEQRARSRGNPLA